VAMKPNGGGMQGLIRWVLLTLFGSKVIHCSALAMKSSRTLLSPDKCWLRRPFGLAPFNIRHV
jgi:hypothetical protein